MLPGLSPYQEDLCWFGKLPANGQSSAVYVIEGTTAHVRVVQTGEAQDGMVRVLAGIDGTAVVATNHLTEIFEGARVRVAAPAGARPAAGQ